MITTVTIHHSSTLDASGPEAAGNAKAVANFLAGIASGSVLYDKFEVKQDPDAPVTSPVAAA